MPSPGILAELADHGLNVISTVITQIRDDVLREPATMLSRVTLHNGKPALRIDVDAEDTFERKLHTHKRRRFQKIPFYGEERLDNPKLDLSKETGTCALVDTIDGTDLLERGLGNWCSAAVFFDPSQPDKRKILASFVAVPSSNVHTTDRYSDIYYSTADDKDVHACSTRDIKSCRSVFGPSKVRSLKKASICFYGQKARNFSSVFHQAKTNPRESPTLFGVPIGAGLKSGGPTSRKKTKRKSSNMRIYTLAGIPMMVRLIDHMFKKANNIDVVFDVCGQNPHDVIPGAYLAMKAGAHVRRFVIEQNQRTGRRRVSGRQMSPEDLEESLMRPAAETSKLRYVISSTKQLAAEIEPFLIEFMEREIPSQDKSMSNRTK